MNSAELTKRIYDCLSDGYDDEESREETEIALYNELSQISNDSFVKAALLRLCDRVEELESNSHKLSNVWYEEIWTNEDLINALEYRCIDPTEENVLKLRESCKGIFDDNSARNEMIDDKVCSLFD